MKNLARLVLFFSACFAATFLLFWVVRFLHFRIDAVRFLPGREGSLFPEIISAAQRALPVTLYMSLLLGLSYTSRRTMPISLSVFCLTLLALGFTLAVSEGTVRLKELPAPPAGASPAPLGGPGLIFSRGDTTIVLLEAPSHIRGPRVVSLADRPLAYQEVPRGPNDTVPELPPLPFGDETSYLMGSLTVDFSLSSRQLEERRNEGLIPFLIYSASLIFFLASLRFVLEMSRWPLANLFLGAVVFRGVLALETFLNAREIQSFLASFPGNPLAPPLITPAIFGALGLIVLFYTALSYTAKNRRADED
jgi:hypothetical protein